jgi:hypothetical protein
MADLVQVPLDQPPEALAEALIADALPQQPLDAVRLESKLDAMALLMYLTRRAHEAAIEKEELIAFAEANRGVADLQMVELLERAVANVEGEDALTEYLNYILQNMRHAVAGDYDAIDLRSDRLLWLIMALSMQLASGLIEYEPARAILAKPEHSRHISPAALQYQTLDYVSAFETPHATNCEYIMLVAECALATGDRDNLAIAWVALMHSPQPRDTRSWADLIERASSALESDGRLDADGAAFAAKVRARFAEVDEDDF